MKYTATMTKTAEAQKPECEYIETDIDRKKREVDFRIIDTGYIRWKDGRGQHVTKRQLDKLCKQYTWACDF